MPNKLGEYIVPVYTWNDDQTAIDKGYTEVIRCRDCEWYEPNEWNVQYGKCYAMKHGYKSDGWDIGIYRMTHSNDFCSRAERKEEK